MITVKEEIAHILLHVNAEANTSDVSQVAGVAGRAQRVRELVAPLEADLRGANHKNLLGVLRQRAPQIPDLELERVLLAVDEDDSGQKIRSVLREWVQVGRAG